LQNIRGNIPENFCDDDKYLIENDIVQWEKHWQKYISQVQREYRSLLSFRNYISLGKTQNVASDTGVALLSAHMSKGLQYNVVFIIGLTEGTFPDYRAKDALQLEQEKNNMYVAVTRAKRLCYLTYPKIKLMPWKDYKSQIPSRYITGILNNCQIDLEDRLMANYQKAQTGMDGRKLDVLGKI
jgi:DNA helicase-2/ATP-dependent DNA helicase PcrA